MPGDALIQVYAACDSPYAPLHPRLCGFQRVWLNDGETKNVPVHLDPLTVYVTDDGGNSVKAPRCRLFVGLAQPEADCSDTVESGTVIIDI